MTPFKYACIYICILARYIHIHIKMAAGRWKMIPKMVAMVMSGQLDPLHVPSCVIFQTKE